MEVSVVVCAHTEDRWSLLLRALGSVRSQDVSAREVILVVDHNEGLLARARAALGSDGVCIVANRERRGLAGARNTGVAHATGDVVVFLDDDAWAEPGWLAALVSGYRMPSVLGVGGSIVPEWSSPRPAWFPPEFDWVVGCTYRGMPTSAGPVRNLIGANMSVRRDVLERTGGFLHSLGRLGDKPMGCEETELCIRAATAFPGGTFRFEPSAVVHHTVPSTRARWTYFRARCLAEGRSKARVVGEAGAGAGLATERAYVRRALPAAVAAGVFDTVRGQASGLARAGTVIAGTAITGAGYVAGRLAALRAESLPAWERESC